MHSVDTLSSPHRTTVVVAVIMGLVAGFAFSSFGMILPWLAALVVAVVGWALEKNRVLLYLAIGLATGGAVFLAVGLGWNLFDAPASGSGQG